MRSAIREILVHVEKLLMKFVTHEQPVQAVPSAKTNTIF